jgi:hypothetical protein
MAMTASAVRMHETLDGSLIGQADELDLGSDGDVRFVQRAVADRHGAGVFVFVFVFVKRHRLQSGCLLQMPVLGGVLMRVPGGLMVVVVVVVVVVLMVVVTLVVMVVVVVTLVVVVVVVVTLVVVVGRGLRSRPQRATLPGGAH